MADTSPDTREGNMKPQPLPEPLVLPGASESVMKSPFASSPHLNETPSAVPAGRDVDDDGSISNGDAGASSTGPRSNLSPGISTSTSFKIPRSISRADSRLVAPLELALSGLERPDGARETRILLPGVDLRHHFGVEGGLEGEEEVDIQEENYGDREGLTVLQTPKGVSLREAVWEAAAIQRMPSYSRTSSRPSSSASGAAAASAISNAEDVHQQHQQASPSPWGALVSNLAKEGNTGAPTRARVMAAAVPPPVTSATAAVGAPTGIETSSIISESADYITPPTIPSLPAAAAPPLETTTTTTTTAGGGKGFLSNLRIDVSYTPYLAEMPSPTTGATGHTAPGTGIPLSPAPMLTPGAPSVPVELRAAAAERLWPLLAPFAPHMLRDDILTPPNQRRFVRAVTNTTDSLTKTTTTTPSLMPTSQPLSHQYASLNLDHNQDAFEQCHDRSHNHISSTWRLDTEMKAESNSFPAAIAIADVSGFTSLTEALTRTGPGGVELLTRCMNSYFAQVIDLVTLHGGDVSKFAGDAMLIVFAPTKEEIAASAARGVGDDGGLGAATRRAAVASKELVDKFGVMSMLSTGEAIAVPRVQVVREGSKFVRVPSLARNSTSGGAGEGSLLRRGASAGLQTAVSIRNVAKTGQKVARTAAVYAGTAPLAVGSRALSAPFKMIGRASNPADLARNFSNTARKGASGRGGISRKRRYHPLSEKERGDGQEEIEDDDLWIDWLDEDNDTSRAGRSGGGGDKDSFVTRTTLLKTRSASDILDLAKEASVANKSLKLQQKSPIGMIEEDSAQRSTDGADAQASVNADDSGTLETAVSSVSSPLSAEEQAQLIRTIHRNTLTALAEAFLGGTLLKIRPPALPDRPPSEEETFPGPEQTTTAASIASALPSSSSAAAAMAGVYKNEYGGQHQPPRPKSAPGTVYTPPHCEKDSFIDQQEFIDRNIDNLSLLRMPSDASVVTATASMTSNTSSMAMRHRNNSFGSFTSIGGGFGGSIMDKGTVAPRLPSVSEREGAGGGGGGESDGAAAWPFTVRKMIAKAFKFNHSDEPNNDSRASSLHPIRLDSSSVYSATSAASRDGAGVSSSSLSLSRRNLKLRLLHPAASWSAPTSPQSSPPESPRAHPAGHAGHEVAGPRQSSFSFGAGGLGYREYSTINTDEILPPLTGQESAPINLITGGLPDDLLSLKVTVAAGMLCAYRVGGVLEPTTEGCPEAARWEFFVADADNIDEKVTRIEKEEEKCSGNGHTTENNGKTTISGVDLTKDFRGPIEQLKETECHAVSGSVVISKEVADLLAHNAELVKFPDGAAELLALAEDDDSGSGRMRSRLGLNSQIMTECMRLSSLSPQERVDAYQILRSHVPFNVRSRVESGHIDSVNEVRVCTVVFLGFPSLGSHKSGGPAESLAAMQTVTQAAQGRMHQDGGFFLQMRCDEKGYLALCAFGLPGRAHEDSPSRGVQAALAVVSNLQRQGYAVVAGVTTGNLFCGVVGSSRRAEYTVFGDAINFAARLMVRASKDSEQGPVLCDEPTRWMAANVADFTALDPVPVKGRAQPLRAFKVSQSDQWTVTGMADVVFDASPVLPRFINAAQKEHDRNFYQQQQEMEQQQQKNNLEEMGNEKVLVTGLPMVQISTTTERITKPPLLLTSSSTQENQRETRETTNISLPASLPPLPAPHTSPAAVAMLGKSIQRHPLQITTNSFASLVGREKELATAGSRLADLVDGRGGGAIFVEGGTGVGKSRLIEEIAWGEGLAPLRQRCIVIASAGRAMRQSEPLNPWRRVFRMLFNADVERSEERRALAGEQARVVSPGDKRGAGSGQFKGSEERQGRVVASDLAIRLAQHVPDYAVWRPVIASALGLRVEELPMALAGATQRSSTARQGGLVAVDDVSVLLKARAHTFNHVPEWNLSAAIDAVLEDNATCTAGEESGTFTLKRPGHSTTSSTFNADAQHVQYSGRSVSARNLDPGRPSSSTSNYSNGSTGHCGGGGKGGGAKTALPPAEMSPQLRALKMRGLLVAILREFVAVHAPLFIVFDDVHLFDGPSWRLLLAVLASCQKEVLFLCTLRPVLPLPSEEQTPSLPLGLDAPRHSSARQPLPTPGAMPRTPIGPSGIPSMAAPGGIGPDEVFSRKLGEYYEEALWRDGSERIALKNFSLEETSRFISETLDGLDVPWAAAQLLYDKSAGMPAYLHQMCLFFKIRALEIARGKPSAGTAAPIISNAAVAAAAGIPSSVLSTDASMVEVARVGMDFVRATVNVHSIVPARVDRLRPDEQLTLKVASVMGATVYTDLLQAAHPKNPSMRRLQANLQALAAAGFLTRQSDSDSDRATANRGISRNSLVRGSTAHSNGSTSNNSTWQFTDILARDVVWDMIPLTQRREWQARLATAMSRFGNTLGGSGGSGGIGLGGGFNNRYNRHSGRRAIPPAIIAYHWSQAALGVETTEWQASLQAIDWWERAASEASLSASFDEEVSLLHNATIIANALVQPHPTGSFNARPDLVAAWRRSRWERCVAAALLAELGEKDTQVIDITNNINEKMPGASTTTTTATTTASSAVRLHGVPLRDFHGGGGENSSDCQKAALVHCLRALHLLRVPMPWSEEYQKTSKKILQLEKSSKLGKILKSIAGKVKMCAFGGKKTWQKRRNDASFCTLPDTSGLVSAALAGDFITLARIESEKDDGFLTEQAEPLIDIAMLAAVVTFSPDWQQNASNFKYVLWVCEHLAGGARSIDPGSALYMVRENALRAMRRAKGHSGHGSGLSASEGGDIGGGGGDGNGGGDGDGDGQQLRSLKEMFSLQRMHGRAMK